MNHDDLKCVMIIDRTLPLGIIANTAAILGVTLGASMPALVGCDVTDADGSRHAGIIRIPIPILGGSADTIRDIRRKLISPPYDALVCADFSDLAQHCKSYAAFIDEMESCPESALCYHGIALCGDRRLIAGLTGNLPLLKA